MNTQHTLIALLCLAGASPFVASATCSTNIVTVGPVTTVTVSAGPNENCEWTELGGITSPVVSVAGVMVPALLGGSSATYTAIAILRYDSSSFLLSSADCSTSGLVLACTDLAPTEDIHVGGIPDDETKRGCFVENNSSAISATATCIFQSL